MAKNKKAKIHKKIDGQLLQMNKKFSNLKMKQKDKITGWVYEEYKKYVTENEKTPDSVADEHIIEVVLDKIHEAQIWIPDDEIYSYYHSKKPHLQRRLDNEKAIKFKSYVSFYKSIVDQDKTSVVICNLKHEIIYMNPAAVLNYSKYGGDKLIGRSLLDCHNPESREKIKQVVDWFAADESHNIVYTFHNEKQNKDVYMVALRDEGKLIGYYEKHEYRDAETMCGDFMTKDEWYKQLFERLGNSKFRSSFHLKQKDIDYINEKGLDTIRQHAIDFIAKREAPAVIPNDGKQTPTKGHPVFIAQHATAICCRECIRKWHKMQPGKELSQVQQDYLVDVIMTWIQREIERQ